MYKLSIKTVKPRTRGTFLPIAFIGLVVFGFISLKLVDRFTHSDTKLFVDSVVRLSHEDALMTGVEIAKFLVLKPQVNDPVPWKEGIIKTPFEVDFKGVDVLVAVEGVSVPNGLNPKPFTGAYFDEANDYNGAHSLAIGDYDGDGIVLNHTEAIPVDGTKHGYSLTRRPIHRFRNVMKNGVQLSTINYCYTLRSGLISFNEAFSSTNTIEVTYDYSTDLDIFTGDYMSYTPNRFYNNPGNGTFDFTTQDVILEPIGDQSLVRQGAFGDYDNDGDVDLVIAYSLQTVLWENNGTGTFSVRHDVVGLPPPSTAHNTGDIVWGDIDNDGDLDLVLPKVYVDDAKVYRNDGGGVFTDVWQAVGVNALSVDLGDYDGDGDLDLLMGRSNNTIHVYKNDFANNPGNGFQGPVWTSPDPIHAKRVRWGDLDNDGDFDFVATDYSPATSVGCQAYRNDGLTAGNPDFQLLWEYADGCSGIDLGDVDQDQDMDLVVSWPQLGANSQPKARYFSNDGSGNFTYSWGSDEDFNANDYNRVTYSHGANLADFDNDGKLDLAISGSHIAGKKNAIVFKNTYRENFEKLIKITSRYEKGGHQTSMKSYFSINQDKKFYKLYSIQLD